MRRIVALLLFVAAPLVAHEPVPETPSLNGHVLTTSDLLSFVAELRELAAQAEAHKQGLTIGQVERLLLSFADERAVRRTLKPIEARALLRQVQDRALRIRAEQEATQKTERGGCGGETLGGSCQPTDPQKPGLTDDERTTLLQHGADDLTMREFEALCRYLDETVATRMERVRRLNPDHPIYHHDEIFGGLPQDPRMQPPFHQHGHEFRPSSIDVRDLLPTIQPWQQDLVDRVSMIEHALNPPSAPPDLDRPEVEP